MVPLLQSVAALASPNALILMCLEVKLLFFCASQNSLNRLHIKIFNVLLVVCLIFSLPYSSSDSIASNVIVRLTD